MIGRAEQEVKLCKMELCEFRKSRDEKLITK